MNRFQIDRFQYLVKRLVSCRYRRQLGPYEARSISLKVNIQNGYHRLLDCIPQKFNVFLGAPLPVKVHDELKNTLGFDERIKELDGSETGL